MMEKHGVIEEGITPPETVEKTGEQLGDHATKRAADAATETTKRASCCCQCKPKVQGKP